MEEKKQKNSLKTTQIKKMKIRSTTYKLRIYMDQISNCLEKYFDSGEVISWKKFVTHDGLCGAGCGSKEKT